LFALVVGVVIAAWLRRVAGSRAGPLALMVEVAMPVLVGILHNLMAQAPGMLGISLVATMQIAIFAGVEGSTYYSVMTTGNFRQAIEGAFALVTGNPQAVRKSCIYLGVCAATFGTGAAAGALLTGQVPKAAMIVPVIALFFRRAAVPPPGAQSR
jgi:uncharacterized membrane protein YoaK (UPF0700 family)